jgi:hypothetical protein
MRSLLLLQFGFNILILVGLIVLAAGSRVRRTREPAARPRQTKEPVAAVRHRPKEAPEIPPPALDELIERADRAELVAEGALRRRLDRMRTRAAG